MTSLRFSGILREIHRRSVWQVVGIYLAMSWGVLNAVDVLTGFAGLPDWTPTMAVVLLLIGLPIVTATAVIQRGLPGGGGPLPEDSGGQSATTIAADAVGSDAAGGARGIASLFTWRNAIGGGIAAGLLLLLTGAAYLAMWTLGIGPVGSLVAQGVLDARDPVLLAEFESRADDSGLGSVVTDAFAVDLGSSQVVTLAADDAIRNTLRMMELSEDAVVRGAVAREVAQRLNLKAVISGEVSRVGSRYLLTARISRPETGEELASFREEAASEDDLLPAIDRISQRLREKLGESLRDVRLGMPLERATTSSFEALRLLSLSERAEEEGDYARALALLEEAVALDPAFAMAYRKMSVLHFNAGSPEEQIDRAATLAFEHRDRLTRRERLLTEANYHAQVTGDHTAMARAYEAVLELHPDDGPALNNLSNAYRHLNRYEDARTLLERAVSGPGGSSVAYLNYARALFSVGDDGGGVAAFERYVEMFPDHIFRPWGQVLVAAVTATDDVFDRIDELRTQSETRIFDNEVDRYAMAASAYAGRVARGLEYARLTSAFPSTVVPAGVPVSAGGEGTFRLWIMDDTTGAAAALRSAIPRLSTGAPPARGRAAAVIAFARVAEADVARRLFDEWPDAELRTAEDSLLYGIAESATLIAEGDPGAALTVARQARLSYGCLRCTEIDEALAHEDLDDVARAIEIWERVRRLPNELEAAGFERIIAIKRLGPLYERVGDTPAAVEAYRRFVDVWANADPELQPQVQAARNRITALGG